MLHLLVPLAVFSWSHSCCCPRLSRLRAVKGLSRRAKRCFAIYSTTLFPRSPVRTEQVTMAWSINVLSTPWPAKLSQGFSRSGGCERGRQQRGGTAKDRELDAQCGGYGYAYRYPFPPSTF